jgi:oligopeptide transport system substrate-binding protein
MRVKTPMRAAAVSAVLALGLAACGGGSSDEGSDTGSGTQQTGGSFSVELTEPSYLAPSSKCYESECSVVLDLVNDPLVSVDPDSGELVFDGLAESIEANEDQTVWTVKLKEGRTFHNGEPVNADALMRAWNYTQNPKNAQDTMGFMSHIEGTGKGNEMSGLKKVDDQTIEVTLSGPFSQFGAMMSYAPAFGPLAEECFNDLKACNEKPIGTGPYQVEGKWRHDEGITLTKWADYKGESTANADTIDFKIFTSPTAELREFQNGNLDLIRTVTPDIYLEAKGVLGDKMIEEASATLTYLGFPTKAKPFDNVKFRQALSMSIDREQIIDKVLNGLGKPATDIPTPPIPGYRDDACKYCTYDPEQAKKLFQESGVDANSTTLELYFNSDAGHDAWVEAAARQIQDNLGINYKLKSTEWAQYLELLDAQKFTGPFRLGWSLDYPSPENYIRPLVGTNGDSNYTGYSNKQLDELLVQGDQAADLEESFTFYQQADDIALEEMPIIPLWSGIAAVGPSDKVDNVRYDVGEGEVALGEVTVVQ